LTAKVICFASAKGGTGKTVTAASLAKLLGALSKKVLLVDVDIDTNGLTLFYLHRITEVTDSRRKTRPTNLGIFEVSSDQHPTPYKLDSHIDLIPASYAMSTGISEDAFQKAISDVIESSSDKYDYIFLDAQAGTDSYAKVAIEHSDEVVIVSEYDPVSIEGIERFKGLFFGLLPKKTWVLFNKVLPEFADSVRDFFSMASYLSPIPWDKDVMLAFANRELALDTENFNEYTKAMIRTARSLTPEYTKDMDSWLRKKREVLLRPVQVQLKEVEHAIKASESALIDIQYKLARQRRRALDAVSLAVALVSISVVLFRLIPLSTGELLYFVGLEILVVVLVYAFISRRSEKAAIALRMDSRFIEEKITELKDRRSKLRVLAEATERD